MLAAAIKSCYDADNPIESVFWGLGIRILSDFLNSETVISRGKPGFFKGDRKDGEWGSLLPLAVGYRLNPGVDFTTSNSKCSSLPRKIFDR
jgi:hypothetical protein